MVVAIAGWFWVAWRVLRSSILAALFMVFIPYRFPINTTDLFCCAVVPFFLIGLERSWRNLSQRGTWVLIISLSMLASLIVAFKKESASQKDKWYSFQYVNEKNEEGEQFLRLVK